MAEIFSATSTSTAANSKYQVFINHRGPDVKKTFASHLYRRLLSHGLRAFLDQSELERGDDFSVQIERAIISSCVHVAIFSKTYAESAWCLKELVMMQESKSPIIPVFYHVKPADLRWTRGKEEGYGRALAELEKKITSDPQTREETLRYDSSTIENWRNTLSHVAGISGFELEACNGDEGELLDKVVEGVLKMLRKSALDVAIYPTGLNDKINDFKITLRQIGKSQIIGIVGSGGVGKSTMAKEFFNRESSKYDRSCFLFDVRDKKGTLNLVQKILFKSLTGLDNPINSVAEGIQMLRMQLSSVNALVIIDDVDHEDQVDALLPRHVVLHSNSLVLITSRNKDVLTRRVQKTSIYMLTGLNAPHAEELFCCHAFQQPYPLPGFEYLVEKFLETCDGLPLSLKVFGALLYDNYDKCYWQYLLEKVEVPSEIQEKLKISYDSLDESEKQIFLDIACYFIGEERDIVIKIWDRPGWKGLWGFQNIQNKCLVELNSENKIKMHNHLRDLGRKMADASLPRRLWRPTEKINDLLQQSSTEQVLNEVRGIRLLDGTDSYDDSSKTPWSQRIFESCLPKFCIMPLNRYLYGTGICMSKLQLLDIEGALVPSILTKVQTPNLIWLRWNKCPYASLPFSVAMNNLRVLQVEGRKLETLWQEDWQAPLQLRELRIDAPLSYIPKSIGRLKHLERIAIGRIDMFRSLITLTELPEEFCLLHSLKALVLIKCSEIKSLPECFGKLTNLRHIQLFDCAALVRLPESFGNLINLQHIDLSFCEALERLPESFGNLTNLEQIHLFQCSALGRLPDSFCKLMKLQNLDLENCINLTMSSETLGYISTLKYINLTGCKNLEVLPLQVTRQQSLEQLRLGGTNLKELPSTIEELSDLEVLVVGGPLLHTLPPSLGDLKNLQELRIENCNALNCLPASLGDLMNLKKLRIENCNSLNCLPASLGDLKNLKELNAVNCNALNCLPASLVDLKNLKELNTVNCNALKCLPDSLGDLKNLKELRIENCNALNCLPASLGDLKNLEELNTVNCNALNCLPASLGDLKNLKELRIQNCNALKYLPASLGDLKNLKELRIQNCNALNCLPASLGDLRNLKELWIWRCRELECLPASIGGLIQLTDLKSSTRNCILPRLQMLYLDDIPISEVSFAEGFSCCNLRILRIQSCNNLVEVGTLPNTVADLSFLNCRSLRRIDQFCGLAQLQYLDIRFCRKLEELPSIETLVSLRQLRASGCVKLKGIRGLGQLTKLQRLSVSECLELEEVEGIQHCLSLVEIGVGGCPKLHWSAGLLDQLQQRCSVSFNYVWFD